MCVCMPVPVLKFAKDNYLRVPMKHAIVVDVAAADSVAIGSGTRSSKGRIEHGACIPHEYGGGSWFRS